MIVLRDNHPAAQARAEGLAQGQPVPGPVDGRIAQDAVGVDPRSDADPDARQPVGGQPGCPSIWEIFAASVAEI